MQATVSLFRSLLGSEEAVPLPHFKKMSHNDRRLLATILSHQPPPTTPQSSSRWMTYRNGTKKLIEELPGHLRSYPNMIERFLNRHIEDDARSQIRSLCPQHDRLNRRVVRSTLSWIKKEIDINIPAILGPLQNAGHLSTSDARLFDRLCDTSAMWIDPQSFKGFFERPIHPKWARQADRCAACVLARLASDSKVILALNAGMLIGRTNPEESRRMDYVECMIDRLEDDKDVRAQSQELGRRLNKKFEEWNQSQQRALEEAGRSEQDDRKVVDTEFAAVRSSARRDENFMVDRFQIQRPSTPRGPMTHRRQPSAREPSRQPTCPLSPTSVYEPIPWREPNRWHERDQAREQARQPGRQQGSRQKGRGQTGDTIGDLIDEYRRTTYEPNLGHEDHFGFKGEPEVEEWPSAATVQEILALHKKNHAERVAAGEPEDGGGREAFRVGGGRAETAASRRASASVYRTKPPTATAQSPGQMGRASRRASARVDINELTDEYRRVIGAANPFPCGGNAASATSRGTVWPSLYRGEFK